MTSILGHEDGPCLPSVHLLTATTISQLSLETRPLSGCSASRGKTMSHHQEQKFSQEATSPTFDFSICKHQDSLSPGSVFRLCSSLSPAPFGPLSSVLVGPPPPSGVSLLRLSAWLYSSRALPASLVFRASMFHNCSPTAYRVPLAPPGFPPSPSPTRLLPAGRPSPAKQNRVTQTWTENGSFSGLDLGGGGGWPFNSWFLFSRPLSTVGRREVGGEEQVGDTRKAPSR